MGPSNHHCRTLQRSPNAEERCIVLFAPSDPMARPGPYKYALGREWCYADGYHDWHFLPQFPRLLHDDDEDSTRFIIH